jgi:glutathione S-transferase
MIKLYQFPLSHYCEKVRWALDYKGLQYEKVNLIPGTHFSAIKKLNVPQSSVPILTHGDTTIQNSSDIITYLDKTFPDKCLTPTDSAQKQEALDWESFADEEIGTHLRRCFYFILFNHKKTLIKYLTYQGPWYGSLFYTFFFPLVKKKMTQVLNINHRSFEQSQIKLWDNLDTLTTYLNNKEFLVGSSFSRADLAIAAMIAPAFRPEKYPFEASLVPEEFERFCVDLRNKAPWLPKLYENHR